MASGTRVLSSVLGACLLACACSTSTQTGSLLDADVAMARAAATGDAAAALPLLDVDATWTDTDGLTHARADLGAPLPRPAISDEQAAQVRRFDYGRVGVVRIDAGRLHALRVWVKRPEGWRLLIYQEVESLPSPPTVTPGIGQPCVNPCETVPYQPRTPAERGVIDAYLALETAAHGGDAETFARYVADEFVVISSNSDRAIDKAARMEGLRKAAYGGVAPSAFVTGQMFELGDVVVMRSQHHAASGARLQITRVWVNRGGTWMSTLSYQTVIRAALTKLHTASLIGLVQPPVRRVSNVAADGFPHESVILPSHRDME